MRSTASVEIDRDPATVFDFTLHRVADWSEIVVSDEVTSDGEIGVGTTFHTVTEERGKRMEFDGEVTCHEPFTRHCVSMTGKSFDMAVDYDFEDLGGRTKVTQTSVVKAKGFLKIVFFLMAPLIARSGCDAALKELTNLKRMLESSD
ncbi:hypothetical protein HAHE_17090 [Haloferula helveola]|uniref:Polyketide cyclase / dehydrase and lipid transport n=1 Tax=Haloferula helveola TaxID=490095 RepID=A0ABM7RCM0_9BACT|nr:hypothetical protein HAHE_17090 [Haloferula helveola]